MHLEGLARVVDLSPYHFARAFRSTLGRPPHAWLLERRLVRAGERLRAPEATIAGGALACGFADQSHLTRLFKRHFGVTPATWRRGAWTVREVSG